MIKGSYGIKKNGRMSADNQSYFGLIKNVEFKKGNEQGDIYS